MKRAVWVILLCTSSARVRFTEGGGGGSVTLHPFFAAKWIQLSIQCFRSINEDSLSQCALLLLQHNLDPHAVFRPVRLYPVAHGNQRWLCSSGSCCSSLPVWIFMFSLISLNILFLINIYMLINASLRTQFCFTQQTKDWPWTVLQSLQIYLTVNTISGKPNRACRRTHRDPSSKQRRFYQARVLFVCFFLSQILLQV